MPALRCAPRRLSTLVPRRRRGLRAAGLVVAVALGVAVLAACASSPERPPVELAPQVDVDRFMGDWYVIGAIPTRFEKGAHAPVESYRRRPDGSIDITFRFRSDAFDGPEREMTSRGFVESTSGAVWGVQFVWPIRADYRISHVAADYSTTVVTREKRDHVWIMARTPRIDEAEYERLVAIAVRQGYDRAKIERMPQR